MSRPQSSYSSAPAPSDAQYSQGYGSTSNIGATDFAQGHPDASSPLAQSVNQSSGVFHEDLGASQQDSAIAGDVKPPIDRSASTASTAVGAGPTRGGTLKKRNSMKRTGSLKRSNSKKSLKAGSSAVYGPNTDKEYNSVYTTPIPTSGQPTEVLAQRFQAWRQLLKSLIAYFREIQASYEMRAKATQKVQNMLASMEHPTVFMKQGGLSEATKILDEYHKRSAAEAKKSQDIEMDVTGALTGLRSDLAQKIKEIKSLSGDFKNSVEKEKDGTRREVDKLTQALRGVDHEDGSAMGKNDPYVIKLGVDRAVERQLDEENYLHRAYLNLESSGRELESIVVGEIQKAYNALAGILKREGDDAYHAVEGLRTGPISMPKDSEWLTFVKSDSHFIDPHVPLRRVEDIDYPGKHHPGAAEVRAGMLERKSKYLKSYTPGWYVLSPTHLHEFKSADKIYTQPPVMSLYLPDQKLGSHSQSGSSSHKFMLKGSQSGNMHKGHNWVFRAETYDTMMAWFEDIRNLTEKRGEERNAFVRKHARSFSGTSDRGTVSSDGLEEDEADAVPYSGDVSSLAAGSQEEQKPQRPQPGGRFPSDLQIPRQRDVSVGESSGSEDQGNENIVTAGAIPGSATEEYARSGQDPYRLDGVDAGTRPSTAVSGGERTSFFGGSGPSEQRREILTDSKPEAFPAFESTNQPDPSADRHSTYGEWMAPAAAGVVGTGAGAAAVATYSGHDPEEPVAQAPPGKPETTFVDDPVVRTIPQPVESAPIQQSSPHQVETAVPVAGTSPADEVNPASRSVDSTFAFAGGDPGAKAPLAGSSLASEPIGGLERDGAHETGTIFPKVVRHDTEMSVSQLHVPGEFPKYT